MYVKERTVQGLELYFFRENDNNSKNSYHDY